MERNKKRIFYTSCAIIALASAGQAATLVNGSMNGIVGSSLTPAGWSPTNSADITSTATQPFTFVANPGDSPDGGTWAGVFADGSYFEALSQTITDFVIGTTYSLSWFASNTGCCEDIGLLTNADGAISIGLDGTTVHTADTVSVDGNWYAQSFDFTATSTSHMLTLGISPTSPRAYMGLDGVSLTDVAAPVPIPAAGGLLLAGLFGAGALGRKRKKA